jgi:hypothetical protein
MLLKFSQFIKESSSVNAESEALSIIRNKLIESNSLTGSPFVIVNSGRVLINWSWYIDDMVYGWGDSADDVPVVARLTVAVKPLFNKESHQVYSLGVIGLTDALSGFLISTELNVTSDEVLELQHNDGDLNDFREYSLSDILGETKNEKDLWKSLAEHLNTESDELTHNLEPIIQDELNAISLQDEDDDLY